MGAHPGFEILGFNLVGGNGVARIDTAVSVGLAAFNGINNNVPVPLIIGQGLDWDTWYSLTLVANQSADRYLSLTVNGFTEDISAFALPRSRLDDGVTWERGALMEQVIAQVIS
ncbi:MAG: hypothetical protein HYV93_11835 [Candidatus Rokubacteria bacterium]|nr:hypothetical protein [Candidatus Rokubacteria bacterium]